MGFDDKKQDRMLAGERRARIAELVERNSSVSIANLKREFGISAVTARSDLSVLEEEGKLRRMYGGAVSLDLTRHVSVPKERMSVHMREKERIARRAAKYVRDGDTIGIDAGTTTLEFTKRLADKRDIAIVTNDFAIAEYVEDHLPDAELVVLGGTFRRNHRYAFGRLTSACLEMLHVDKAFLAANAFLPNQGFMTEYEPMALVKSELIAHARTSYVLIDASKVGASSFIRFAELPDIDVIVMDDDPDGIVSSAIRRQSLTTQLTIAS